MGQKLETSSIVLHESVIFPYDLASPLHLALLHIRGAYLFRRFLFHDLFFALERIEGAFDLSLLPLAELSLWIERLLRPSGPFSTRVGVYLLI